MRFLKARPTAIGLAAVSVLSVMSSLVGFAFQVVLAARFGAGAALDSYLFSISVPTFLSGLGSAALSYLLVPALVRVETAPTHHSALLRALRWRIGSIALTFFAMGIPAVLLQPLTLPEASELREMTELVPMIALGWAIGATQLFSALFVVELNARRQPLRAACLSLPQNFFAILFVLITPGSILAAPVGVLFGSIVAAALGLALTRVSFANVSRDRNGDVLRGVFDLGKVGPVVLAMSCFSAYAVVDAFWAPRTSVGVLAMLGYAQRLVIGIGSLIIAGPSAILVPRFAANLRDQGETAFLNEVHRTCLLIAAVAIVAGGTLAFTAKMVVGIAFGRGEFNSQYVMWVAGTLRAMMPGFCAMLISLVLTRAIFCLEGVGRSMAFAGVMWTAVYFVSCGLLLPLGSIGFGIGYSIAWLTYLVIATLILRRYARSTN